MIKDEVMQMARKAGISKPWDQEPVKWETLERFADLVAAAEREACANVCDKISQTDHARAIATLIGDRIRARGNT